MSGLQAVLAGIKEKLKAGGIESWEIDARLLVQHALGLGREELFLNSSRLVSDTEVKTLDEYAARRLAREPVSRILGVRAFWKSDFKISRETLDPRPDSETVIEAALKYVPGGAADVLDLGTGSGCLLLSLLQEWPEARGVGLDISADAVETARENARVLSLDKRSEFRVMDWNSYVPDHLFDVVISNPPYIAAHEIAGLEPEVVRYDPLRALVGGADGLMCYRNIIQLLPSLLKKGGYVLFEIGHTQAKAVKDLLEEAGFTVLQTVPDLAGHDRCIAAQR